MVRFTWALAATSALSLFVASNAFAATELAWWHAMTGANNEAVEQLAKEFNESQTEYKVVPVFKGTYPEALNAGIAAFRAKQAPAILQVFDAGSGVMLGAEGAVVPVADVLQKGGYEFKRTSICRASCPIIRSRTARCCPSPSTPRRRSSITTRMPSPRRASTPRSRR